VKNGFRLNYISERDLFLESFLSVITKLSVHSESVFFQQALFPFPSFAEKSDLEIFIKICVIKEENWFPFSLTIFLTLEGGRNY